METHKSFHAGTAAYLFVCPHHRHATQGNKNKCVPCIRARLAPQEVDEALEVAAAAETITFDFNAYFCSD
jgi:hypothetical protein